MKVVKFFDRLEDRIRAGLSRAPIIYALVGAVGIILLWKGVWELAEYIPGLWGPGSIVLGLLILLGSGLLVSFFIGDSIIMSGLRRDKKLAEKSERDILTAKSTAGEILDKLEHLQEDIHQLAEIEKRPNDPKLPLP